MKRGALRRSKAYNRLPHLSFGKNTPQQTPLHKAVESKKDTLAEELLGSTSKEDLEKKNGLGLTAFQSILIQAKTATKTNQSVLVQAKISTRAKLVKAFLIRYGVSESLLKRKVIGCQNVWSHLSYDMKQFVVRELIRPVLCSMVFCKEKSPKDGLLKVLPNLPLRNIINKMVEAYILDYEEEVGSPAPKKSRALRPFGLKG